MVVFSFLSTMVITLGIILVCVGVNKKSAEAQKAAAARRQSAPAGKPGAKPPINHVEAEFEEALTQMKELLTVNPVAPAEGAAMLDDADCHGGSMPHAHSEGNSRLDDEDCAGGSMAHSHTEGVSRAAQSRRMAAIDRAATARTDDALMPDAIDARALRRAVVMAEVLGKPRALSRR